MPRRMPQNSGDGGRSGRDGGPSIIESAEIPDTEEVNKKGENRCRFVFSPPARPRASPDRIGQPAASPTGRWARGESRCQTPGGNELKASSGGRFRQPASLRGPMTPRESGGFGMISEEIGVPLEVRPMETPFPGMDPYLEHLALWPSLHTRLIVAIANQLRPQIRPRYVASVEDRVFIESASHDRIPDVWVQETGSGRRVPPQQAGTAIATPLVVEVQQLEVREHYIAILAPIPRSRGRDRHRTRQPQQQEGGSRPDSYLAKQREIRGGECHLVEIDLCRSRQTRHERPEGLPQVGEALRLPSLVNRWPARSRFELHPPAASAIPCRRSASLSPSPTRTLPFLAPARHWSKSMSRPTICSACSTTSPASLRSAEDREWATAKWRAYRRAHANLFRTRTVAKPPRG